VQKPQGSRVTLRGDNDHWRVMSMQTRQYQPVQTRRRHEKQRSPPSFVHKTVRVPRVAGPVP